MTDDEQYIWNERLGLCGAIDRLATKDEIELAKQDVRRFRKEIQPQPEMEWE